MSSLSSWTAVLAWVKGSFFSLMLLQREHGSRGAYTLTLQSNLDLNPKKNDEEGHEEETGQVHNHDISTILFHKD